MSPRLCPFCRTPYAWGEVKKIQFEMAGAEADPRRPPETYCQAHRLAANQPRPATNQARGLAATPNSGRDGAQDDVLTVDDIALIRTFLGLSRPRVVENEELPSDRLYMQGSFSEDDEGDEDEDASEEEGEDESEAEGEDESEEEGEDEDEGEEECEDESEEEGEDEGVDDGGVASEGDSEYEVEGECEGNGTGEDDVEDELDDVEDDGEGYDEEECDGEWGDSEID